MKENYTDADRIEMTLINHTIDQEQYQRVDLEEEMIVATITSSITTNSQEECINESIQSEDNN